MTRARLRRLLIELVGTRQQPDLAGLTASDSATLQDLAIQHRLQPLLHHQHRDSPGLPAQFDRIWTAAYRTQAIVALSQQAELDRVVALLRQSGFAPIALKGAWLCRYAYPQLALRPLRDLDLLLDPDSVIAAFDLLLAAGYRLAQPPELSLAELVRTDKHLPPLLAPGGTVIELHHRLWEPDGRLDHASPAMIDAALRERAVIEADGIAYPAPGDMLAHLIVHAVYSHRFDCGPLLLADIDYLLRARRIDWAAFWDQAASQGWRSGARLVLALVAAHRANVEIVLTPAAGPEAPAAIVDAATNLLLQDLASRKSAGVLASIRRKGLTGLSDRLLGRRRLREGPAVPRDKQAAGSFAGWAGSRLRRTLGELANREARQQGQVLAQLSTWLDTA